MLNKKATGIKDAMEFTGYSRAHLYRIIHLKKIPYYKPTGGKIFFRINELEEFISLGKIAAAHEALEKATKIINRED
ncbi:MAG: helix-turn-helix domain-containing protein [Tannerellaceae bacterium]|jgi:excisionase family DNA binding protein|nr:helix-turn-helix domain-containing protein [Tannerellaceae bacterium]